MKKITALLSVALLAFTLQAAPKKLLVVSTTAGYRHASITNLETMLSQLGKKSGSFTVDFVRQPPGKPAAPTKVAALPADATDDAKAAHKLAEEKFTQDQTAYSAAEAKWEETLKATLQKLSPDNLKNYDGVVFASTTGELPIPDRQGFLDWIKAGHAFIGLHAASDTFHQWPEYKEMLGAEFIHHGRQVSVDCLNQDPANPATASLPQVWHIQQEEIYEFTNYDSAKVHDLLIMDKYPQDKKVTGHFPVSWCKSYGTGKVFYTSLGHREDLIDVDFTDRYNPIEVSQTYQAHVLGGIEWALRLKK